MYSFPVAVAPPVRLYRVDEEPHHPNLKREPSSTSPPHHRRSTPPRSTHQNMRLPLWLLLFPLQQSNGFAPQQIGTYGSCLSSSELASTKQRWGNLDGKIRERMGKAREGSPRYQQKESKEDKKRRQLLFMQQKQAEKKKAARIYRPLNFQSRLPLTQLQPGIPIMGVVISLTDFGAYVDVGSETDGLLHISQLSADTFITHPRQVLTPGDTIVVTVRSVNPERRKLHLTLLPPAALAVEEDYAKTAGGSNDDDDDDRIPLADLQVDDELWGQILRVTQYGAYVEMGCAVQGFLHFMDHPGWCDGKEPREFMQRGDRIRVWVLNVEHGGAQQRQRVKLTAVRPEGLPGPRRDIIFTE